MTRFSASRDVLYTAPPGPDEDAADDTREAEAAELTESAIADADGVRTNGSDTAASDD